MECEKKNQEELKEYYRQKSLTRNEGRIRMALRRAHNCEREVAKRPISAKILKVGVKEGDQVKVMKRKSSRFFRPPGKEHYTVKDHAFYYRENHKLATIPRARLQVLYSPKVSGFLFFFFSHLVVRNPIDGCSRC